MKQNFLGRRLAIRADSHGKFTFRLLAAGALLAAPALSRAAIPPPEKPTWEERFIESNIAVSEWFDGLAEGLDLFLVGRRVTERKNETSVRIENSTYSEEGRSIVNRTSLGINPRLPNLEEYWRLKFSTYDEREERRGVRRGYLRQQPLQENYGATVGLFRKLGDVRVAFQPRIELQDPLKISHSLEFESVADMETYEVNPKFELFASASRGPGLFGAFNLNFELTPIYSLTLINDAEYFDRFHHLYVANGFSIGQMITHRSSLSYSLIFGSENRDNYHLQNYSLATSWNHMLYHQIFEYQITPHLNFHRDRSFRGTAGFTFRMSLNF